MKASSSSCSGTARKGKKDAPVAFVGKGVCFDSGGLSLKPGRLDDGHEGRYGRGRRGDRRHARAGRAQGQGQCGRRDRPGREHAVGQRAAPRRCRDLAVRPDHRSAQHRCRGPAGAGRCADLHPAALQAEIRHRSGDADRRHHGGAGRRTCRPVLQRRQAGRPHRAGRPRRGRAGVAPAAGPAATTSCSSRRSPT